jgi:integrase/recombinase XerD
MASAHRRFPERDGPHTSSIGTDSGSRCAASGRLRHFLFTWLKTQGIDDALIQPYSGHASRTSLEIYSRLALPGAQASYDGVIGQFPV